MKTLVAVVLVSGLTTAGMVHAQCSVQFRANVGYPVRAHCQAVGDLNGDGKADVVVANSEGPSLMVMLGQGDGRLLAPSNLSTYPVSSLELGDLNGDGRLDLIVGTWAGAFVRLGNGDGTFQPPVMYSAGGGAEFFVLGDFNHDGRTDMAVSNNYGGNVSILLGNGDGTFQPAVNFPTCVSPLAIVGADFNGDGNLDLAVASDGVWIHLGNGDGTFQPGVAYPVLDGRYLYGLAAADLNGDGTMDLAAASNYGTVWILSGNGDGTFQSPVGIYSNATQLSSIVVADFNQDGWPDLAASCSSAYGSPGGVLLLQGDGAGGFLRRGFIGGAALVSLAAGDLDGDGRPDLVGGAQLGPLGLRVLLNASGTADFDGDGSPGTDHDIEAYFACLAGNCCASCGSADFNGDGDTGTDQDIEAFFRVLGGGAC